MSDILEFLRARLDEDEQVARAMKERMDARRLRPKHLAEPWPELGAHIARHDPARVLREVEAKRRIVEQYAKVRSNEGWDDRFGWGAEAWGDAVRLLAAVYSDHPDYRQE